MIKSWLCIKSRNSITFFQVWELQSQRTYGEKMPIKIGITVLRFQWQLVTTDHTFRLERSWDRGKPVSLNCTDRTVKWRLFKRILYAGRCIVYSLEREYSKAFHLFKFKETNDLGVFLKSLLAPRGCCFCIWLGNTFAFSQRAFGLSYQATTQSFLLELYSFFQRYGISVSFFDGVKQLGPQFESPTHSYFVYK